MNLIVLAGNSTENFTWAEELKTPLVSFSNVIIQEYGHWKNDIEFIDMSNELQKLLIITKSLNEYIILAKSVGVILALQCIFKENIKPVKCIFVGTAFNWAKENGYPINQWLKEYNIETLFIQNENDPAVSFDELSSVVGKSGGRNKFIKLPGNNHKYSSGVVSNLTKEFLQ